MTELEYLKKYLHPTEDLNKAIERLNAGEPVQYIVGDVDFYGNRIDVNKNVLIPRPETEELVEKAQFRIQKLFPTKKINILDIGTGSGCISITLKKLFPTSNITGVDISKEALQVAKSNAQKNATPITFIQSNIFEKVEGKYDVIISNPPYIREDEEIMDIVKKNEPHIALYAPKEGLYFYEEILSQSHRYVKERYLIAFEIGETQGEAVKQLALKYFPSAQITIEKDIRHFDRFVFISSE